MSEQSIQKKIYSVIKDRHSNAAVEISVLNRCIDIAYFNNEEELVTIEVKLKDWRKAIEQALDHQLYADKSYICLPKPQRNVSENLLSILKESGIGLIWFEIETKKRIVVEEFVEAKKNDFCWAQARRKVESMIYA